MSANSSLAAAAARPGVAINPRNFVWVAAAFALVAASIAFGSLWALNFIDVIAGVMWTGIDLFLRGRANPPRFALRRQARRHHSAHAGGDPRRQMVQLEPIRIPAASTSAPPIITFAAADSGGTSMYRHWIHAMTLNSMITTMIAMTVAV